MGYLAYFMIIFLIAARLISQYFNVPIVFCLRPSLYVTNLNIKRLLNIQNFIPQTLISHNLLTKLIIIFWAPWSISVNDKFLTNLLFINELQKLEQLGDIITEFKLDTLSKTEVLSGIRNHCETVFLIWNSIEWMKECSWSFLAKDKLEKGHPKMLG